MTYMTAHSDSLRIENLFISVFSRIGKDSSKYKKHGLLNADNIEKLPISTVSIILDWFIFEIGISDDAKDAICDFRREYTGIETKFLLSDLKPNAQYLGQELMNKMINDLKDILDQIK